jgi:hypothetical protein
LTKKLQSPIVPIVPIAVRIANGVVLPCTSEIKAFEWWIQGNTFQANAKVIDMGAYDLVLGMDWLERFRPMTCDWLEKWIEFQHQGKWIMLQGIVSNQSQELQEVSIEQVVKWDKGNDLWTTVLVESSSKSTSLIDTYLHNGILAQVKSLISESEQIFQEPSALPPSRAYDHSISMLPNTATINCRPYRYSPEQKNEIERQVESMLKVGTIICSLSPFASPVLLVKKKDVTCRFCVDYRKLNSIIVKNKFPLPIIDEFLDEKVGAKYFSAIDLASGFHQIRMVPADEMKIAFKTHHGHFQFKVMPFGWTNAPATFQCLMNAIFCQHMRKFLIFMDDILVFSKSFEEHLPHLRIVFQVLLDNKLFLKLKKYTFARQQISYLGHVISDQGVSTNPEKTEAMLKWPIPQNFTELRGFLGLTGYYKKFVAHYGTLARQFTSLLHHKTFSWNESTQQAFDHLKHAMTTTPVLAFPDFSKEFVVEIDDCDTGNGVVLSQNGHPITYFSKGLSANNQKLSTYEKEFLIVLMVVDKWRSYLHKNPFLKKTDHQSLCHLQDQTLSTDL